MSLKNNLESFKDLAIDDSPTKFSSLSGFNPLVDFTLSSSASSKNDSDTVAFKTLADLTSHHLQNTSNLLDNEKTSTPEANFLIPKLSIKKDNCNDINEQLNSSTILEDIHIDSDTVNDRQSDDSMDSLERSLSSVFAFSKDSTDSIESNLPNIESKNDPIVNTSDTQTFSLDSWFDLNCWLKENTISEECMNTRLRILDAMASDSPESIFLLFKENFEIPPDMLPTTLNLINLNYVKLPQTKRNISLFGRTLCMTWKLRKPILKREAFEQKRHETIKIFDFSVPFTVL